MRRRGSALNGTTADLTDLVRPRCTRSRTIVEPNLLSSGTVHLVAAGRIEQPLIKDEVLIMSNTEEPISLSLISSIFVAI